MYEYLIASKLTGLILGKGKHTDCETAISEAAIFARNNHLNINDIKVFAIDASGCRHTFRDQCTKIGKEIDVYYNGYDITESEPEPEPE